MHLSFYHYLPPIVEENLISLCEKSIRNAYTHDQLIVEKLLDSFERDWFFEPHLILKQLYNPVPQISVRQLLYGYVAPANRPSSIEAYSDKSGSMYIPEIGYFMSDKQDQILTLNYNAANNSFRIVDDSNSIVPHLFLVSQFIKVGSFQVELLQQKDPLIGTKFIDEADNDVIIDISKPIARHRESVEKAMFYIKEIDPWYFNLMQMVIKKFLLFENSRYRSFASMSTLGISYFSVSDDNTVIFFLEEIVHQCSHNILYAAIQDGREIFTVNAKHSRMVEYTRDSTDHRTILSAFHGIFSLTCIVDCLDKAIDSELIDKENYYELVGRLSDNAKRLRLAIDQFKTLGLLTFAGEKIFTTFEKHCEYLYDKRRDLIESFNTSNQSYVFSYDKFLELNPVR